MDVMEALRTRRSIRKYTDKPVEQEKLDLILEAARISPSASNQQNWRFIAVTDKDKLARLYEASFEQPAVQQAPCALVVCASQNRFMDCGQPTTTVDGSIAMSYMILEAHELGLGTCWLGHFKADIVKDTLGIPDDVDVIAFTPLGYPAVSPSARPRKTAEEVIRYNSYE